VVESTGVVQGEGREVNKPCQHLALGPLVLSAIYDHSLDWARLF
jgi:hypothetical protein